MTEFAIKVENLSKRYRIGIKDEKYKTLSGTITKFFKSPFKNYQNLRSLNNFKDNDRDDIIWALKDVSFEIKQGEAVGIIGRNGAGKSTLLKLLSRITEPTTGRIILNGRIASLLEVGTGFNPELTGRENIFLNGTIMGMTRREITKKLDEIIDFSGVEKFLDTPVKRYSSGMYVRLAFAVAAHLEPEILVIDEVLAVGDVEFQKKCLGKMGEVAKGGRTVLFVSHNLNAIEQLCEYSILLNNGIMELFDKTNLTFNQYIHHNKLFKGALTINKYVRVTFTTNKNSLHQFDSLSYSISINNTEINKISSICLLIHNSLNERVAIIDFRSNELITISSSIKHFQINGQIEAINLISGMYYLGLYIESVFFTGNIFDLHSISILDKKGYNHIKYNQSVRGYLEFNNEYSII